ncbi:MAG: DUF3450 family protein [Puniceicoccaceae bacterium]|nr:MAG: DUF3450 family protein [Puniceicoccaceae bacterium]
MIKRISLSFLCLGLLSAPLVAREALVNTREALAQWAQTEQMISEAENNWMLEKSMLQDSEQLLNRELTRLQELIEELEETATAADEERSELTSERETLAAAAAVVEAEVGSLEAELKEIIKTYPAPLIERIQPLIRRLPDDPAASNRSLGERVQNIVGILSQADRFNGTLTQTSESRELGDGRVVEVRTLYWGLGGAFYVDMSGQYAGVGYPSEDGWEWPLLDGAGPQIRRLLDVYDGSGAIQFVEIPASIK